MSAVYIATSMLNRDRAVVLAERLRASGRTVTSTWHDSEPEGSEDSLSDSRREFIAQTNFAGIDAAHAVVFIDHPRCRGALVEIGYAFGRRRPIFGIGPRKGRSLMAEYAVDGGRGTGVCWCDSLDDLVSRLLP